MSRKYDLPTDVNDSDENFGYDKLDEVYICIVIHCP